MDQPIFRPVIHSPVTPYNTVDKTSKKKTTGAFADLLGQAVASNSKGITISKHAQQRMEQRNLHFDEATWDKLEGKLAEARTKGIKDSLVLLDNSALIVNASTNTVITAMKRTEAGDQIFSNINGAIIME